LGNVKVYNRLAFHFGFLLSARNVNVTIIDLMISALELSTLFFALYQVFLRIPLTFLSDDHLQLAFLSKDYLKRKEMLLT